MSRRQYTYSILRYIHDPAVGEVMNVGVVIYSPDAAFLDAALLFHHQRLSDAFAGFDGDGYRKSLRSFAESIASLREELFSSLLASKDRPADASLLVERIWPDRQLSFVAGHSLTGMSDNFPATLRQLYDRFVTSQYDRIRDEWRTDEEVWESFRKRFQGTIVTKALRPVKVQTKNLSASFAGFKNERWHLFQPISLDFARESSIKRKAKELIGEFVELADSPDVQSGKIYLLLGSPSHPQFQKAYESAKQMLMKIPVDYKLVEERDAEAFAVEISKYINEHTDVA